MKRIIVALSATLLLAACQLKQSQNVYKEGEVGVSRAIEYGTIKSARDVEIEPKNSGTGTLLGAGIGAGGGSYVGGGSGNAWATAGAAVAGAVIGTVAEQQLGRREGVEYIIAMQNGETKSIVQEKNDTDQLFRPGQKVMLQYCDQGEHAQRCQDGKQFQRLQAVDSFPAYEKKRRKIVKG